MKNINKKYCMALTLLAVGISQIHANKPNQSKTAPAKPSATTQQTLKIPSDTRTSIQDSIKELKLLQINMNSQTLSNTLKSINALEIKFKKLSQAKNPSLAPAQAKLITQALEKIDSLKKEITKELKTSKAQVTIQATAAEDAFAIVLLALELMSILLYIYDDNNGQYAQQLQAAKKEINDAKKKKTTIQNDIQTAKAVQEKVSDIPHRKRIEA